MILSKQLAGLERSPELSGAVWGLSILRGRLFALIAKIMGQETGYSTDLVVVF